MPAPEYHRGELDSTFVAPRNSLEEVVAEVWRAILKLEMVGVHDNFFTVGGDSILALAVRSEAEKRGIAFDIDELFARPTVAELAESISPPAPEGVPDAFALLPLIDRAALHDAEDAFPANALQLGMLFHSIERTESTRYKDVFRYRVAMPWLGYACGICDYCVSGRETLCLSQKNMGYSFDGGFGEYVSAYARYCVKVPDGVDPFDAAPLTCAGVTTPPSVCTASCCTVPSTGAFKV